MPDAGSDPAPRLATYGTLAPGRVNHHRLAALRGRWRQGTGRSALVPEGWGAELGYPALILDPDGPLVDVVRSESPDLAHHRPRLDAFEGAGYRRVVTRVATAHGEFAAWIYVNAETERA